MPVKKNCPHCGSENQYLQANVPPWVKGMPTMHVIICKDCGLIRHFATEKERERLTDGNRWEKL